MRFGALLSLVGAAAAAVYPTASPREIANAPMPDDSPRGFLWRGDSRAPEVVFAEGFRPYRVHYLLDTSEVKWVSLTRRATTAISYANGHHGAVGASGDEGYVYVVSPEGISGRTAHYLPRIDKSNAWKYELAVEGEVPSETIVGAYFFQNLKGARPKLQRWIANPGYKYAAQSPFTPRGTSCWARSCSAVSHFVSTVCSSINCFKRRDC
ncbi:uncharacterized protein MAM_08096 [Metarhizium album ARSEF 1941]|uniref:Uncharacterized protein n=1 Tax=Metarhizium album (strain ARSEF 1941) TaxID=1081103 RepID=A0A0B2WKL3_METAS|nr:uncharacterized protein MAM_08096 [Metarhizium album ARSEF 1941]KHN94022.1 hypothetical protein MAM_08096 [Metarhizium album ARSEF 1941]